MNPLRIGRWKSITFFFGFFAIMVMSCRDPKTDPEITADVDEVLSGGKEGTVYDETANAFGNSLASLTTDEVDMFVIGNSFNRNNWVTAPSSTSARDGLGPFFNASSCSGCHLLDGKGSPTDEHGTINPALLFRLSVPGKGTHGEPVHDPNYGEQFNPRAILGVLAEGDVSVTYSEMPGSYPDGTTYSLHKPSYTFSGLNYGPMTGTLISPRIATQMIGVGLLEAVPDATINSYADANDANSDGISGRPNYIWDEKKQSKVMGRFGWKANQPTVEQQSAGAFNGDIGITSSLFSSDNLTVTQRAKYGSLANGGNPEVADNIFQDVVFYIKTLAVPARRHITDQDVASGKALFVKANCTGCHIAKMTTGTGTNPVYLSGQTIRPYTDLLLHDMGNELADNRPDYEATGNEWRTPPLWGLGLVKTVNKHTFFLHDGRARNVEEAILWHGGEAEKSKKTFMNFSQTERASLLKFIDSL